MTNAKGLIDFIKNSPTAFHTVRSVVDQLTDAGFTRVYENDASTFSDGGKHFVVRADSSNIAFKGSGNGFMITASHSDSPCFKVKCEQAGGSYAKLATEKYGGMINYTWLDRPLSIAGRIIVKTDSGIKSILVDLKKPIATIPSVAIHLNRGVNDGAKFNPAVDLLPLVGSCEAKGEFLNLVAENAGVETCDILSHDLFLYNADEGIIFGAKDEFILSPRIDDLGCVYASLKAFIDAPESDSVAVLAVFDNEEVGSETKQGAASTFLDMTLRSIAGSERRYSEMLCSSFMVSADNAHALHPNHPELYDSSNSPVLGGGVVVKYNANQRYTTDAVSDGIFSVIANRAGERLQKYSNRADLPGGSTLGSISNTRVSVSTIDIGLPQLAMHSANETSSISDLDSMIKILTELYSSSIDHKNGETVITKKIK